MPERKSTTHEIIKNKLIVFRRPRSEKWQCRYCIDNVWYRASTNEYNLDAAIQSANMVLIEAHIRDRMNVAPTSKLFRDVAKIVVKQLHDEIDSGTGKPIYKDYIRIVNRYLIPILGRKYIDRIGYEDLDELKERRIKIMGRIPTRSTILNHNAILNRIFDEAIRRGFIKEEQRPKLDAKGKKTERRCEFTLDEIKILIHNFDAWVNEARTDSLALRQLMKDYVMTLIDTGARPGREIFELKWGQIKFAPNMADTIVLNIQMSKTGQRTAIGREPMLQAIRGIAQRNYNKSLEEVMEQYPNDYIFRYVEFISKRQLRGIRVPKFLKPSSFPRLFDSYLKRHNILIDKSTGKKRVMYSLRHTYATFALTYDQVPIHTLAKQMGTSVVMIEKHYSHLDALKAIEQLSGIKTRGLLGKD